MTLLWLALDRSLTARWKKSRTCINMWKLENLNNLIHQNLEIEMIIHDLQTLLQLKFFEIDFDENLIFIDFISSSLIYTEMRNLFNVNDVKRDAQKFTSRFAMIKDFQDDFRKKNWHAICALTAHSLSLTEIWQRTKPDLNIV